MKILRSFKLYSVFLFLGWMACHTSANSQDQIAGAEPAHDCINKIIAADDALGTKRNHDSESMSLSETIRKYVNAVQELDFKHCPDDFRNAFRKHMQAWEEMIPVTDHYPDLRGEMHTLFDKIEKGEHTEAYKLALDKIWSSWAEVEKFIP